MSTQEDRPTPGRSSKAVMKVSTGRTELGTLGAPIPAASGGRQNGSSVAMRTCCAHVFATLGADLHAQSMLINKIYASELIRKFIIKVVFVTS